MDRPDLESMRGAIHMHAHTGPAHLEKMLRANAAEVLGLDVPWAPPVPSSTATHPEMLPGASS